MKNVAEEDWVRKIIELLSLDKRSIFDRLFRRGAKYDCLPVFGGILLHINGQGVIWLPKSYIDGLLSKAGLSSVVIHKFGLLFSLTIPGGGFLGLVYDFFKNRVWKEPPTEPRQYLPRMIGRVDYGSFTMNPRKINVIMRIFESLGELVKKKESVIARSLKSIVKIVKEKEKPEENAPFCVYFLRFINKIAMAKESQKSTTPQIFTHKVMRRFQRIPTFKCRDEQKLLKFMEGLEEDGFKVMKLLSLRQEVKG